MKEGSNAILRKRFSEINMEEESLIPDLLSLQTNSYKQFLGCNDLELQKESGLYSVFKSTFGTYSDFKKFKSFDDFVKNGDKFPIKSKDGVFYIFFDSYQLGDIKYSEQECLKLSLTYSQPLTIKLVILTLDVNKKTLKDQKEQEIYLCDIPLMTKGANFIYSGIERVVISQLKKVPGVLFDLIVTDKNTQISKATIKNSKKNGINIGTKKLYTAKIIPETGSWVELGILMYNEENKLPNEKSIYLKFNNDDNKSKFYFLDVLNILGFKDKEEILRYFYKNYYTIKFRGDKVTATFEFDYKNKISKFDLIDPETEEIKTRKDTKIKATLFPEFLLKENMFDYFVLAEDYSDNGDEKNLSLRFGERLDEKNLAILKELKKEVKVFNPSADNIGDFLYQYVKNNDINEKKIKENRYRIIQLLDETTIKELEEKNNEKYPRIIYNLSEIGRINLNKKLEYTNNKLNFPKVDETLVSLTKNDLIGIFFTLLENLNNDANTDDVDDLQNRKLFTTGDLVKEKFDIGMTKIKRNILEKINDIQTNTISPQSLINPKQLMNSVNDFFATSQLSQFMDSTNSLSELAHKRRVTLFGPGGIKDKRSASIDVRDIHYSQYGRICPIETPEGQNIGLVNNIATFAKIDKYGFIQAPYVEVKDGVLQIKNKNKICIDDLKYLTANDEKDKVFCAADTEFDATTGKILSSQLLCRMNEKFELMSATDVNYIEVSQKQFISVTANLIPFIANDDGKRSMMASAMMKQAVPFVQPDYPLVGTGLESKVASDCGAILKAEKDGVIKVVDASKIIIESENEGGLPEIMTYQLSKFKKTNNNTSLNQRPIVKEGQVVKEGNFLTCAQVVENGEIALGKNILVAFLPWDGYNHEDSIVISNRLIQDEVFTSVHIEELKLVVRDTKNGPEKITRDIPNLSQNALKKLDESGIIHIGAEIKTGDILVGKVTPKTEPPATPEEKLLKAIFGDKSNPVKDTSLYVDPNILDGKVIDVQVFSRQGLEYDKDDTTKIIEEQQIKKIIKQKDETIGLIKDNLYAKISLLIEGKTLERGIDDLKKGEKLTKTNIKSLSQNDILAIQIADKDVMAKIKDFNQFLAIQEKKLNEKAQKEISKVKEKENLPAEVLKIVKILIASKQKLQPGDKMSGRHGNKGIVSKVVPINDMPYMKDGTPIDILLTPSGIPSRMNVGQILETHLGFAAVQLGKQITKTLDLIKENKERADEVRKQLLNIFDLPGEQKQIKAYSDEQVLDVAEKYRKGVPFAIGSFEKINIADIEKVMEKAGIDKSGQITLYDGRTGEPFDRPVTVGYMYFLKLHHLVDTKIHARSTGPYSLVTQQPLGGKSNFGGQRFGEMECWALQGYGAAYTLQEMLTVKSDDIKGRVKIYENIIQGLNNFVCGIPETFNVTVSEIRGLGLNMELIKKDKNIAENE